MPAPRKTYVAAPKRKKVYAKQQKVRSTYLKRDNRAPQEVALNASRRAGGSDMGSMLGGMAGMALGGPTGAMIGNALGGIGGSVISRLFGSGDYKTNADQLTKNNLVLSNSAQAPKFGSGRVLCKFRHQEYLGDVFSSATPGAFQINSYSLNPGIAQTFPWLSGVVGAKFQQYRMNGCVFEFRSMSADALNSTNTALGSVIMSTDYDSADAVFTTKIQMENTEFGVSCKPSVNMIHGIECKRSQTPVSELFIRAYDVPSGKDIRLYDLGRFSIATTGCQGASVNLGELWVSYDIDCFKAIEQVPGYINPFATYYGTNASPSSPFGTSQSFGGVPNGADQIGLTITPNRISFPLTTVLGATYLFNYGIVGSTSGVLTAPVVTTGNGLYVNSNVVYATQSNTTPNYLRYMAVQYKGGASAGNLPYINIANFTWTGVTFLETDIFLSQVSGNFGGSYTIQVGLSGTDDEYEDTEVPEYISVDEEKKVLYPQQHRLRIKV